MRVSELILSVSLTKAAHAATFGPSPAAVSVCKEIHDTFPSKTAFDPAGPSGLQSPQLATTYTNTTKTYWDVANSDDSPACIFYPQSAGDVASAVRSLNKYPTVPFALKSGGHNFNRGFSSTNGGVLISFRPNLQEVVPSADRNSVDVGPGAKWKEVMATLDPLGRCAVGGRADDVGVGGYVILGGISYLTAQYGFASDNVINFETVLPNGTVVNANKTDNTDLFWALRGGGNLFGIVTKYTLQTHPIGKVWGGPKIYTADKAPEVMAAISSYVATFNETKSALIPTAVWMPQPSGLLSIFAIFFFWDGEQPPQHVFRAFDGIKPTLDQTKTQSYPELLNLANGPTTIRTSDAVNSLPNMPQDEMVEFMLWHYHQAGNATFLNNPAANVSLMNFAIQPIPAALQKANKDRGPAALSVDPAHGDKVWIEYSLGWNNPVFDEVGPFELLKLIDEAKRHQQRKYAGVKPTNYQSGDLSRVPYEPLFANDGHAYQPILQSYGAQTWDRLMNLREAVDPQGFMQSRTNGFRM